MDAERWKTIKKLLEKALETASESRAAFLDEQCGTDVELRREVEKLLEFENSDGDLLERDAVAEFFSDNNFAKDQTGRTIGNYKISRELGVGGMGAVFLAERVDGDFDQKVALKFIKRGLDSESIVRRFLNERRILASLEHPNIARLVDGGAHDGVPYFVMEYVAGESIVDYADKRGISLDERLRLFADVCAAVSFAHRNLVIHRDLKPSNILVTPDGVVKLLDFGIAKLLDADDSADTATQTHIFTPDYASPEQIRGEKLTTSTDVYSLGVVLYELLTGRRPFKTDGAGLGEVMRLICDSEPSRPSAWRDAETPRAGDTEKNKNVTASPRRPVTASQLKGDLDAIVLKALRKEPERRYASVEQFAEDIRLYSNRLPVTASAGTWKYRASKFLRRHRVAVVAGVIVAATFIVGFATTFWQYRVAAHERDIAARRSENLRRISNSFVTDVERTIRDLPGSMPARRVLLERAVEQLDELAADSGGRTTVQLDLVWAYQNLASMPDAPLTERAKLYEKSFELLGKVRPEEAGDLAVRDRLATLHLDYLYITRTMLDVAGTVEHSNRAVEIVDGVLREMPDRPDLQDSFWTANYHYALTMQQLGNPREMTEAARRILPAAEFLHRENPPDTDKYNFMKPHLTHLSIGFGLAYGGEYENALGEFQTALGQCLDEQKKQPDADILRRNESNIRLQMSIALAESGRFTEADADAGRALAIREKLAAANPTNFDYSLALADGRLNVGRVELLAGRGALAVKSLREAIDLFEKLIERDSERTSTRYYLARTQIALGAALALDGKNVEAQVEYVKARNFLDSVNSANSADAGLARALAEVATRNGIASHAKGDDKSVVQARIDEALELWENLERRGVVRVSDRAIIAKLKSIAQKSV